VRETPLGSSATFTPTRRPRYPFVAVVKATDAVSGMQLVGLTTDLSEGGCGISTRKGPFSEGTRILLEITKNDVTLVTNATVIYNLKDQFMGIRFEEMTGEQAAILAGWIKAASAALPKG
jgi:PilZ domain